MNEQIKELYNKAWLKVDPSNPEETFTQAFTELIVQECGRVMEEKDNYYGEWMKTVINEHFGIE